MLPELYPEEAAFAADQVARIAVSGSTGYVAANIVARLLESGHIVHGTTRSVSSPAAKMLMELPNAKDNLTLFEADVLNSSSFDRAFADCTFVIHTASPFINNVKRDQVETQLVSPAVQGSENFLRALERSPMVKRVVLTSSIAAAAGPLNERDLGLRNLSGGSREEDWSIRPSPTFLPYYYSKRESERKAWEVAKGATHWDLVVLNPGLVMGPPAINRDEGESIGIMKDMVNGQHAPACPKLGMSLVDVRDVAAAHCLALFHPNASGQRFILSGQTVDVQDMVREMARIFPGQVAAPSILPRWLGSCLGPCLGLPSDITCQFGLPINEISSDKAKKRLGLSFLPMEKTLGDMAVAMSELKMFKKQLKRK